MCFLARWRRITIPADARLGLLRRSAALGARLSALLDPDAPVEEATHGISPHQAGP
ncbi:MAG TPA: hypothetical protein PK677_17900 [Acidiphilium sp.]|nr:hypothetical protein [Acidiphilium sp.]